MSLNESIAEDLDHKDKVLRRQGDPTFDTAQAIAVMLEKHGVACDIMHAFDWGQWSTCKPGERLALIPAGQVKQRLHSGAADSLARSASLPLQQNVPNDPSLPTPLHLAFDWSSWTMPVASKAETVASQRLSLWGGQLRKGCLCQNAGYPWTRSQYISESIRTRSTSGSPGRACPRRGLSAEMLVSLHLRLGP